MHEAIVEGRKARSHCRPNPPVGCVLVLDGQIVGRGHTQPPGSAHAEIAALESAGSIDYARATLYVTLEPCSFHGRTPSCAQTLVSASISKIVIGLIDSDPRNSGAGVDILRKGGIAVEVGVLSEEVFDDLQPYLKGAKRSLHLTASAIFLRSGGNSA